jgi:RNA polymerase sigma-70 factor (ECF subfamily)
MPNNPAGWLMVSARRKALDRMRRRGTSLRNETAEAREAEEVAVEDEPNGEGILPDERLGLIFMCCHPSLAPESQVALTLRSVGGLTTAEIARLFLTSLPTMAARLTRAKLKIKSAGIPFREPPREELAERMAGVLAVVYLIFTQGYAPAVGDLLLREELCDEAIRLGAGLLEVAPNDSEVMGLQALMLFQHARRNARLGADGQLVRLGEQNRSLWADDEIERGLGLLDRATGVEALGPYALQAAIAAEHVRQESAADTDWARIANYYGQLEAIQPSPFVRLNRAVAAMEVFGPAAGLSMLSSLEGPLGHHAPFHIALAEMRLRLGEVGEARESFGRALELSQNEVERRFLRERLQGLLDG